MRLQTDRSLAFSPSDPITFLEGEFAAWMERAYAERGRQDSSFPRPDEDDQELNLIRGKGIEHESAVLTKLEALQGPAVRIQDCRRVDRRRLILPAARLEARPSAEPYFYSSWVRQRRKALKTRGHLPNDEAALKLLSFVLWNNQDTAHLRGINMIRHSITAVVLSAALSLVKPAYSQHDSLSIADLPWLRGPVTASLGPEATIGVPGDCLFLGAPEVERFLRLTRNNYAAKVGQPRGVVLCGIFEKDAAAAAWWSLVEYVPTGRVEEYERARLDAGALFQAIRQATAQGNGLRRSRDEDTVSIEGWSEVPGHDRETSYLTWALRSRVGSEASINATALVPGEPGVMRLTMVVPLSRYSSAKPIFRNLVKAVSFASGSPSQGSRHGNVTEGTDLRSLIVGAPQLGGQDIDMVHSGGLQFERVESSVPSGWIGGYNTDGELRLRPADRRDFRLDIAMLKIPPSESSQDWLPSPAPFLRRLVESVIKDDPAVSRQTLSVRALDGRRAIASFDYLRPDGSSFVRNRTWHLALVGPADTLYVITATASEVVRNAGIPFTARSLAEAEGVLMQAHIRQP